MKVTASLNDCVCVHAHRLRELCVKLMFLHPVDYGRKAEELLWRKVYYEVIQVIKTNKKVSVPAAVAGNLCFVGDFFVFTNASFPVHCSTSTAAAPWSAPTART